MMNGWLWVQNVVEVYKEEADPLVAEVMTAYLAIIFSKEMGFTNIKCEGDSLHAI